MQLNNIHSPVWADQAHSGVLVTCDAPEIGETSMPFLAMPNDSEAHGVDVYTRAVAGEFGVIADFVPLAAPLAAISPRQIRQALTRAGLREAVEAAVAAGGQDLKDWWEFSTAFERLHPEVVTMGTALGQTDTQLDALWALGASL